MPNLHPTLLAIETTTEACSVALLLPDGQILDRFAVAPRQHASLVLPWIDALLQDGGIERSRIDGIACALGPGAFTGVRLGIAVAQGLASALAVPVIGCSTLATLAAGGLRRRPNVGHVVAAIDARMGEIYLGAFVVDASGRLQPLGDEWLGPIEQVPESFAAADAAGVGTGFAIDANALGKRLGITTVGDDESQLLPHAADLARLAEQRWQAGDTTDAAAIEPSYLRNRVAETMAERAAAKR